MISEVIVYQISDDSKNNSDMITTAVTCAKCFIVYRTLVCIFSNDPQYHYIQIRNLILNGQEVNPVSAIHDVLKKDCAL